MKIVLATLMLLLASCDYESKPGTYSAEDVRCVTTEATETTLYGGPTVIAVRVNYVLSGAIWSNGKAAGHYNERKPGPLVLSAETLSYWMTAHEYKFCADIEKQPQGETDGMAK